MPGTLDLLILKALGPLHGYDIITAEEESWIGSP
jgi:DNA-binding PadR family transcriptional regulator